MEGTCSDKGQQTSHIPCSLLCLLSSMVRKRLGGKSAYKTRSLTHPYKSLVLLHRPSPSLHRHQLSGRHHSHQRYPSDLEHDRRNDRCQPRQPRRTPTSFRCRYRMHDGRHDCMDYHWKCLCTNEVRGYWRRYSYLCHLLRLLLQHLLEPLGCRVPN